MPRDDWLTTVSQGARRRSWREFARERIWRLAPRAANVLLHLFAGWFILTVVLILLYRFVDPIASNLMLIRALGGTAIEQTWVPVERMSPQFVRAIIAAEDARFCRHMGLDWKEMLAAVNRARDGAPRGASTISMQVSKNLFLWPGKSYIRKILEVPITLWIELAWPKWRIFEVYANVAEWGPGVFGVEAAARHHFGKSAARLGEREAALLAASLPNPFVRDAGDPGPKTERISARVLIRMRAAARETVCVEARARARRKR